jgi:hypothetical protein
MAITNDKVGQRHLKSDWHWEGISVIIKSAYKAPEKVIILDKNGNRK